MYSSFKIFQNHLDFAQSIWKQQIKAGDWVVDATCGQGYDSLFLAKLALDEAGKGKVIGFDIQAKSIEITQKRLQENLSATQYQNVQLFQQSHEIFPAEIQQVALIVYNLGYLPGGDKTITTLKMTTLKSIENGLTMLKLGGMMSITCYPGHLEGREEEEAILRFCQSLPPMMWSCTHHRWINRRLSPSLILIQKAV